MSDIGFVLYTRKLADRRLHYYAKLKSPLGKWGGGVSTGKTSEAAAERWAWEQVAEGTVPIPRGHIPTLDAWAKGFFGVGGRYDESKRARGREMSVAYLSGLGQRYKKYVSTVFGSRRLTEITTMDLEQFFLNLYQTDLSGSSVNGVLPFLACMAAAGCGLRHGEAVALRPCDLATSMILIQRQYDKAGGGFKPPKWGSAREMPAPKRLQSEIENHARDEGLSEDDLLFPSTSLSRPIEAHVVLTALRNALEKIGISKDRQKRDARFLDLHSLRHTYITRLRTCGVADWELQAAAGHKSIGMTDNYTHARGGDLAGVRGARLLPFQKIS